MRIETLGFEFDPDLGEILETKYQLVPEETPRYRGDMIELEHVHRIVTGAYKPWFPLERRSITTILNTHTKSRWYYTVPSYLSIDVSFSLGIEQRQHSLVPGGFLFDIVHRDRSERLIGVYEHLRAGFDLSSGAEHAAQRLEAIISSVNGFEEAAPDHI